LKFLKNLRTTSLHLEYTGSCKKSVVLLRQASINASVVASGGEGNVPQWLIKGSSIGHLSWDPPLGAHIRNSKDSRIKCDDIFSLKKHLFPGKTSSFLKIFENFAILQ